MLPHTRTHAQEERKSHTTKCVNICHRYITHVNSTYVSPTYISRTYHTYKYHLHISHICHTDLHATTSTQAVLQNKHAHTQTHRRISIHQHVPELPSSRGAGVTDSSRNLPVRRKAGHADQARNVDRCLQPASQPASQREQGGVRRYERSRPPSPSPRHVTGHVLAGWARDWEVGVGIHSELLRASLSPWVCTQFVLPTVCRVCRQVLALHG